MSFTDDSKKTFIIKHAFNDVKGQLIDKGDGAEMNGPIEEHFGVEWKLRLHNCTSRYISFYVDCLYSDQSENWTIETEIEAFSSGKEIRENDSFEFSEDDQSDYAFLHMSQYEQCSSNNNMPVEFHVTIKKMTGIKEKEKKKLKHFDDDDAKELSDVVLMVGGEKFYLNKMYLSSHSTYFKTLFTGNFSESNNSEIELKDVDPRAFQHFLELIYGESYVIESTCSGILKLADYFQAKTAFRRCEEFLMKNSKNSLTEKFGLAIKYKMDNLKSKCLEEMKNSEHIEMVLPEIADSHENCIYKELLAKIISFQ